jgi:aspartyl-tRNA(Asn)/glutamyl-tRNA(Gln) amidotransferase subunit A
VVETAVAPTPPLADAEETAASLAARIRRREISALEAVSTALARIDALDGALHAFCTRCDDVALAQAAALDRRLSAGDPVGPLAGVPVAVKDLIDTKGLRTTYGSPLYADHVPEEDDVVVERLVAAGAIVVGKTNTSEFGYGAVGVNPLFPATRNPWNLSLTSGGSSAGTAAAVASGMVPFGLGSDGGGSVRIPASLCGIVGVKPSFGRTPLYPGCRDPRFPGASGWESLEHIGPLARTVEDAALALSVITGPSSKDRHSLPAEISDWQVPPPETMRGLRIAFSPDLGFAAIDPEARAIAEAAARRFEHDLGAIVEFAHPKVGDTQTAFQALVALDTDRNGLRGLAETRGIAFDGPLGELLATPWTADAFTDAILARKTIANVMWRFMKRYDFLMTPATAVAAFPAEWAAPPFIDGRPAAPSAWTPFSAIANLTGQPAASVPAGWTRAGLPVGLQIVGRRLDDLGVLAACGALEVVQPWTWRRPNMSRSLRHET